MGLAEWIASWLGSFLANVLSTALTTVGILQKKPEYLAVAIVIVGVAGSTLYLMSSGKRRKR